MLTIKPDPDGLLLDVTNNTTHTFDEYGNHTITNTIVRFFTTDRKLQRAVDEARSLYDSNTVDTRTGDIVEKVEFESHTFTWERVTSSSGLIVCHRVFTLAIPGVVPVRHPLDFVR